MLAGTIALAPSLAIVAGATAVPISGHLRVEGATSTLFDGNVTTDGRTITAANHDSMTAPPAPFPCDLADNGMNGGFGTKTGTPVSALYDASVQLGVPFAATWYPSLRDFLVDGFGGDTGPDAATRWGYAVNYTTANVGGCEFQLAPGSDVLWASNYFSTIHLLKLNGPASANAGSPITVNVTDGSTGRALQGATVGASTTDASGAATLSFPSAGVQTLKAAKSDSVRSAALSICVHNGNDGTCGATAPGSPVTTTTSTAPASTTPVGTPPPVAHLAGIVDRHRYRHGQGPRVLRGSVDASAVLRAVRLRLTRKLHGKCSYYSATGERFVPIRCGHGFFFTVGNSSVFSYLLPSRLGTGHYAVEVQALDATGARDRRLVRGQNESIFDVG